MFQDITVRFGHIYPINVISTDPWVVTFDNFVSDEEGEALISTIERWERSTDSGLTNEFGETGRILSQVSDGQGRRDGHGWMTLK